MHYLEDELSYAETETEYAELRLLHWFDMVLKLPDDRRRMYVKSCLPAPQRDVVDMMYLESVNVVKGYLTAKDVSLVDEMSDIIRSLYKQERVNDVKLKMAIASVMCRGKGCRAASIYLMKAENIKLGKDSCAKYYKLLLQDIVDEINKNNKM